MDYLESDLNLEQAQDNGNFPENPQGQGEAEDADASISEPMGGEDSPQRDNEEDGVSESAQEKPKRKSRKKKEDALDSSDECLPAGEEFLGDNPEFEASGADDEQGDAAPPPDGLRYWTAPAMPSMNARTADSTIFRC